MLRTHIIQAKFSNIHKNKMVRKEILTYLNLKSGLKNKLKNYSTMIFVSSSNGHTKILFEY